MQKINFSKQLEIIDDLLRIYIKNSKVKDYSLPIRIKDPNAFTVVIWSWII